MSEDFNQNFYTKIGALNGIFDSHLKTHKALLDSKLFEFSFRREIGGSGDLIYALKTPPRTTCKMLALPPIIVTNVELTYDVYINSTFTDYGDDVLSSAVCLNRYDPVDTNMTSFRKDVECSDYGISVLPEYIPAFKFSGGILPEGVNWIMTPDSWAVLKFTNQVATAGTVRFATYWIELCPD